MEFRLHHIGVIVPHAEMVERFVRFFDAQELWRGDVPKYQAECIFVRWAGIRLEFVIPYGDLLKRANGGRGGIHHIGVVCDHTLGAATRELIETKDAVFLEPTPNAAASILANFIQPICTGGVLIELVEPSDAVRDL